MSSVSYWFSQIAEAEERIAELRMEISGLDRFCSDIEDGQSEFERQIEHKQVYAKRAGELMNNRLAQNYREKMSETLDISFYYGVADCFDGAKTRVLSAMHQKEEEIKDLERVINSLYDQIAEETERQRCREQVRRGASASSS